MEVKTVSSTGRSEGRLRMEGPGNGLKVLPTYQHPYRLSPRRGKYRNKKTVCLSKHEHDSKFEAEHCNRLMAMQKLGEIQGYALQMPFDLIVNGTQVCRHIVDFLVVNPDGTTAVHEAKGVRTAAWSIKHKLFRVLYPNIKYIIIQKELRGRKCPKNLLKKIRKTSLRSR